MKIDLKKYLIERDEKKQKTKEVKGPVITISREFGCGAKELAQELCVFLNKKNAEKNIKTAWKWINKEVIDESAKELRLKRSRIKHIFEGEDRSFFDELLLAHTERYYTNDKKIKKTVEKVITNFANEGYVIIVGRGSEAIIRENPKALHIRLQAPFDWRVKRISETRNIPLKEVIPYAINIDNKREKFRKYFSDDIRRNYLFDIIFNCQTMNAKEIIDTIINILEKRKLI